MGSLVRLRALSPARRSLLLEAAVRLAAARLRVLLVPFRWLGPQLGRLRAQQPLITAGAEQLAEISWALHAAARHLPLRCSCLTRAIAGKRMLGRRGVASTLVLGLARDREARLKAHAWLSVGGEILPGWEMEEGFAPVATYSDEQKLPSAEMREPG